MPTTQWLPHWDAYMEETQVERRRQAERAREEVNRVIAEEELHRRAVLCASLCRAPTDKDQEMEALGIEGDSANKRRPVCGPDANVGGYYTVNDTVHFTTYTHTETGGQTDGG